MESKLSCSKCGTQQAGRTRKDQTIAVVQYKDADTGQPLADYRCRACGHRWTKAMQPLEQERPVPEQAGAGEGLEPARSRAKSRRGRRPETTEG